MSFAIATAHINRNEEHNQYQRWPFCWCWPRLLPCVYFLDGRRQLAVPLLQLSNFRDATSFSNISKVSFYNLNLAPPPFHPISSRHLLAFLSTRLARSAMALLLVSSPVDAVLVFLMEAASLRSASFRSAFRTTTSCSNVSKVSNPELHAGT
jgi:hypothetical protein